MSLHGITSSAAAPAQPRLSLRARLLLKLEAWFPPCPSPEKPAEQSAYEYHKAAGSYARLVNEIGGLEGKRVLDFGCGWGGETLWLSRRAERTIGVDIDLQSLRAAEQFKSRVGGEKLTFIAISDQGLPFADRSFDAVFSTNVFEHVMKPAAVLREIYRILRPGGSFLSTFGPLFYSPLGYHLPWAVQVPFAHLLVGLGPMMEIRNLKRQSIHPACWEDTGLNRITCGGFRRAVRISGLRIRRLRRVPVRGLTVAAHLPWIGNLFTFGLDCHLVRPG